MSRNMCAKKVLPEHAYEVWQCGEYISYVLKKYKSEDAEAKDPHARWLVSSTGPHNAIPHPAGSDSYVRDIKSQYVKLDYNPYAVSIKIDAIDKDLKGFKRWVEALAKAVNGPIKDVGIDDGTLTISAGESGTYTYKLRDLPLK